MHILIMFSNLLLLAYSRSLSPSAGYFFYISVRSFVIGVESNLILACCSSSKMSDLTEIN